jgi:hypothetical protein
MNSPTEPLAPQVVDALLSADLDGDFDAAARDHGLTPATARARLAATGGVDARARALAASREALATVEPLSASARSALVAVARGATRPATDELATRRSRRPVTARFAGVAVAAAAVLLVVGLAVSMLSSGTRDDRDDSATGTRETADATSGAGADVDAPPTPEGGARTGASGSAAPFHDFGVVEDDAQLHDRVLAALGLTAADRAASSDDEQAGLDSNGATGPIASTECIAARAQEFGVGPAPTVLGPATYRTTPAEVLVFADGDAYLVLTIAIDDCRVLASQFVNPGP